MSVEYTVYPNESNQIAGSSLSLLKEGEIYYALAFGLQVEALTARDAIRYLLARLENHFDVKDSWIF